jgi:hypothetical protein
MEEMLGAAGKALWSYWTSLRGEALVASREDFDPMAIARHLPVVSLLEQEGPLTWRVRLVGTEITRRSGDLKGRNYIDLLVPEQREREDRRLATMVDHPCGSHAIRENRRPSAIGYFVRTVALPLWSKDGTRKFVIATNEEINRDRFGTETGLNEIRIERVFLDIGAGIPAQIE